VFWLRYQDENGEQVESDKKIWIHNFQVDKETNTGKTDFGLKLRKDLTLDAARRDWLRNDLLIELWETRPRIKERKNEDGTEGKEVVFNNDKQPIIDTRLRGIMIVNLSDYVHKVELTSEDLQTHQKMYFFDSKFKEISEFMFQN
jgi:hypothetical protein